MNWEEMWELLQTEPTQSKKEIRRAYAKQSKLHHPEEEPGLFAQLNQAYQEAMRYAQTSETPGREEEKSGAKSSLSETPGREKEKTGEESSLSETPGQEGKDGTAPSLSETPGREEEKAGAAPSLLEKLAQAEERRVEESKKQGALRGLIEIFEDPKRRNRAKEWQAYFLSEAFLGEQFEDYFGTGMLDYLENQEECDMESLPVNFVQELAVAYGLFPDALEMDLKSGEITPEDCTVKVGDGFPARAAAAKIWNMQEYERGFLHPIRLLGKAERWVRLCSFSDYLLLHTMQQKGYLTEKEKKNWGRILDCGNSNHLFERKGDREVYPETRSECLITLYTYWVKTEEVPECVCKYMYHAYQLKEVEQSSNCGLYRELKKAILARYPEMDNILYGEDGKEQMILRWYRELMEIVTDHYRNYVARKYGETEEIRQRVETLFQRAEWEKIKSEPELFEKLYEQLPVYQILPGSLAHRLYDFWEKEEPWEDGEKGQDMLEGLVRSFGCERLAIQLDERQVYPYEKTSVEDIGLENKDFWEYFLMTGFGERYVEVIGERQRKAPYIAENRHYLPGYVRDIYLPSVEWQKLFTRFDEKKQRILNPVSTAFLLPDGRTLKVEFHLHYVLYRIEDVQVIAPVFTFAQLRQMEPQLEKPEQFFFLLAVTEIAEEERKEAEEMIEERLRLLPLYGCTIPFIAAAIAADNDRNGLRGTETVLYGEKERFCFKMEVSKYNVKLYRKSDAGWENIEPLSGEGKKVKALDLEGKIGFAREKLEAMRQPDPELVSSHSLAGIEGTEKMRRIIEALKEQEMYRKQHEPKGRKIPYKPGFPWSPEEIPQSVRDFFAADGGWMTQSFVILHYGSQQKKCFERIFYSTMNIFGFDLYFQSPEFNYFYNMRHEKLENQIKEKHLVVGRFGWGRKYLPDISFDPVPFAIGESGTFYAHDGIKFIQAGSLEELMVQIFDFSTVTQVDVYGGMLTVSRFDHDLEYCYTTEDCDNWINIKTKLLPEVFTKFGI
ncbi:MAG: J domain-containing protein [Roseburia sp.]|nr:J domain-containing protein [Roseburia sp.]